MRFTDHAILTWCIWTACLMASMAALVSGNWEIAFVALITLVVSIMPVLVAGYAGLVVPRTFITAIVLFVFATLFLGEVLDFYNRFWWWDIALHGGSAVGFGLIGFVAVFMMFQGDRFAAPHIALCFFSMCFAIFIGTVWEVFEFAMDQGFGLNMQKSGLNDTMGDLIVNLVGALLAAAVGYLYLIGRERAFLASLIAEFVERNPRFFGKAQPKRRTDRY
ncbi:hypothetical protein [Aestuariivita sp.]|jgi:hypothetical protein|uniref:hypothetical protein n=1 Tax=Aestuariivita sp. TaxID=1872407 RepID=UPI00216BDB9A|nr:hypothetical protein [Aestuariivita sp.]MCE8009296.1 hypothetical protein [Aestuariivita sp.]